MDGFGGVSRGRQQWTVRGSRELATDLRFAAWGAVVSLYLGLAQARSQMQ